MLKKICIRLTLFTLLIASLYGLGRLYYHFTAGFTIHNISSDFAYNPEWETRPLNKEEKQQLNQALDQSYSYLGKGCQSYVFLSEDQQFVIKFFKYQRFRLQPWLAFAPPLPALVKYRQEKLDKKWNKLDGFVKSWKIAFENLKEETGLVFVHLNKTNDLNHPLTIYDKLGHAHTVNLDQMEFCIQQRAEMLCPTLMQFKDRNDLQGAQTLVHNLLKLILFEYARGFADNDHALMQNTGVVNGNPIHIDVGQFVQNEHIKDPNVYHQELFTKTYKFNKWLKENYTELSFYLESNLKKS